MPNLVHLDISADDPERVGRFYRNVFGWKVDKLEGPAEYWLISTAGPGEPEGVGGGIAKRELPWQSVTPTIGVASVDDTEKRIVAEGGSIVLPKQLIPGVGHLLTFKDTEGNVFAALEAAPGNPFAGP